MRRPVDPSHKASALKDFALFAMASAIVGIFIFTGFQTETKAFRNATSHLVGSIDINHQQRSAFTMTQAVSVPFAHGS